jgi:hypothetical protein
LLPIDKRRPVSNCWIFHYNHRNQGSFRPVLFRTYFRVLLDYLLTIGTMNRTPNSEGITQMTNKIEKPEFSFLPLALLAVFAVTLTVMTPANAQDFRGLSVEKASYATYTPSMAARGQRFYVGP